jgi:hypothetical protein
LLSQSRTMDVLDELVIHVENGYLKAAYYNPTKK